MADDGNNGPGTMTRFAQLAACAWILLERSFAEKQIRLLRAFSKTGLIARPDQAPPPHDSAIACFGRELLVKNQAFSAPLGQHIGSDLRSQAYADPIRCIRNSHPAGGITMGVFVGLVLRKSPLFRRLGA